MFSAKSPLRDLLGTRVPPKLNLRCAVNQWRANTMEAEALMDKGHHPKVVPDIDRGTSQGAARSGGEAQAAVEAAA